MLRLTPEGWSRTRMRNTGRGQAILVSYWGVPNTSNIKNQMAHHTDPELLNSVLQLLTEQGHSGFAEGIRLLVNEAMLFERHQVLQALPYERTDARKGYANGFKDKTVNCRVRPISFDIPQVRGGVDFYPSALEKGRRSEQALKLAPVQRVLPSGFQ
jgi:hypothetical protein